MVAWMVKGFLNMHAAPPQAHTIPIDPLLSKLPDSQAGTYQPSTFRISAIEGTPQRFQTNSM